MSARDDSVLALVPSPALPHCRFVEFMFPDNAVLALGEMDGTVFQGRVMHVLPAKDAPTPAPKPDAAEGGKSYKSKMEEQKRKAAADGSSEKCALSVCSCCCVWGSLHDACACVFPRAACGTRCSCDQRLPCRPSPGSTT